MKRMTGLTAIAMLSLNLLAFPALADGDGPQPSRADTVRQELSQARERLRELGNDGDAYERSILDQRIRNMEMELAELGASETPQGGGAPQSNQQNATGGSGQPPWTPPWQPPADAPEGADADAYQQARDAYANAQQALRDHLTQQRDNWTCQQSLDWASRFEELNDALEQASTNLGFQLGGPFTPEEQAQLERAEQNRVTGAELREAAQPLIDRYEMLGQRLEDLSATVDAIPFFDPASITFFASYTAFHRQLEAEGAMNDALNEVSRRLMDAARETREAHNSRTERGARRAEEADSSFRLHQGNLNDAQIQELLQDPEAIRAYQREAAKRRQCVRQAQQSNTRTSMTIPQNQPSGFVAVATPPAVLQPGQPGFPAPTAMHVDPCGDGVEGAKFKDVKKHWDKVQDKFKDAHKDALNDDLSAEQAQQAAAEAAAKESIKRGGNRWDASLAAAAAIRFYTLVWMASGHAAYNAAIHNGASEREAIDIANWAMQRVYALTMGWTIQLLLTADRACSRPAYMVQQNLMAMNALSANSSDRRQQAMGNAAAALMLNSMLFGNWGHHGHHNQHHRVED